MKSTAKENHFLSPEERGKKRLLLSNSCQPKSWKNDVTSYAGVDMQKKKKQGYKVGKKKE